jgi:aspartate 1-decarboxylase
MTEPIPPLSRRMLKSKLHRARVTDADVNYEGSVTIDKDLLEAADIYEYEQVHLWNVTRGTRLVTYAMIADRGSGSICVNGAAAHLAGPGDVVIISTFCEVPEPLARAHRPNIVLLDDHNRIKELNAAELAGPKRRGSANKENGPG